MPPCEATLTSCRQRSCHISPNSHKKRRGSWTPNRFATRTESATLTSYFAPNSTGSLTLPRTIGRTYGWVTLAIRSATRCFFSSNVSFCWA